MAFVRFMDIAWPENCASLLAVTITDVQDFREATGACRLDTVTKGKTVPLVQKSFCVSEKDHQYAEIVYPMVQDSIRDGIFLPRRGSSLCSKRYCGYWKICETEYGGCVRDD